ncbi:transporter [Cutibacterium acnes JCM 18920]|nr:transporter [Cutibacterium acnes JCM 18920]
MTEIVMSASDIQREVASSAYSGVRFLGGACAPTLAGALSSMWGSEARITLVPSPSS